MAGDEVLDTIRDRAVTLTINRATEETVVRGHVVPGRTAVLNVSGYMQPMSDRELRLVPPGMNTMEWHNIWALQEMKEDDLVDDGTAPTVKVVKLKHWKEGPFWHAQGVRVEDALVRTVAYELTGDVLVPSPVPEGSGTHP